MSAGADHDVPALLAERLQMSFAGRLALAGVDLRIPSGTICGLIGPNGAGKTTAMRIVATDLVPTEGCVQVFGLDVVHSYPAIRQRLGFMTDSPDLLEDMRLADYLDLFAALHGLGRQARRTAVDTVLEMVGLRPFRNRRLDNLSKGEAQRVALARTLLHDPDFLVLDEPADGLDPRGRVELRELLILLRERGKTILVSSHILTDLEAICDSLVFLDQGRVVLAGGREELRRRGIDRERYVIEVAPGSEPLLREALAHEGALVVMGSAAGVTEVEAPGGTEQAAALLERLTAAKVRVASFHRRGASLEELFLRLTDPSRGHPRG